MAGEEQSAPINEVEAKQKLEVATPEVDSFSFKANLSDTIDTLYSRLSNLQMFYVGKEDDSIIVSKIDSRDIQKRPYLFFIIKLSKDNATVYFSLSKDASKKLRKLYVLKNFISILSLIIDIYHIEEGTFFQYIDSAIDDVVNSLSQSYSVLFNNYESLLMEERELRKLNIDLTNSNKELTANATMLANENENLKVQLKTFETYSDDAIMVMIEEWLEAHDSAIDVVAFADAYKILPSKVEEVLNKMVASGYIEMKG